MRNLLIQNNDIVLKVQTSTTNTHIEESFRIKKSADMFHILETVKERSYRTNAIHKRSLESMVNEWKAHNLLYFLGVKRKRTASVDLEFPQSKWVEFCYKVLAQFNIL